MISDVNDEAYWNERYNNNTASWDIGKISSPVKEYIDQLTNKDIDILIPGCGNAYEAGYLLDKGFTHITLADISQVLVDELKARLAQYGTKQPTIICEDFFNLDGQFDMVIEQTFFCALDPSRRAAYVEKMHSLVKPGGKIVGVLFNRAFEGGPPFGGSLEEYETLFSSCFVVKKMEACYNSIKPRLGSELWINLQKR